MEQALLILTNVPDAELANSLANALVKQRLAACVNIMPSVQSVYRWQGKVERADEIMLIIKSTQSRYAEVAAAIGQAHPYEVPEIIALPIAVGSPAYLNWVATETKKEMHV